MADYTYKFPMFSVATDIVAISHKGQDAKILLIERKASPFAGKLALPGGYVNIDELTVDAAVRELWEETGVSFSPIDLTSLDPMEGVSRDPRGRVISFPYAVIANGTPKAKAGDDAATADWYPLKDIELAFDHDEIVQKAMLKFGFNNFGQWPWPQ